MSTDKTLQERIGDVQREAVQGWKNLDKALEGNVVFSKFEEATGQSKMFLVAATALVAGTALVTGFGPGAIINLVGFLYPMYMSFKAIKSASKADDTQWLMYWVVFALFSLFESFADLTLGWLPLYFFIKFTFLLFCMLPQTRGSQLIFNRVIDPFLSKYEGHIDMGLNRAARVLGGSSEGAAAKKTE